ncbi:MAG: hypothetical protein V2I46_14815 [Bacteroides sp.]|nr:hypothetical protein [Bacteroides sp.]
MPEFQITLNYTYISSVQGVRCCIPTQFILFDDILQFPGFTERIAETLSSESQNPQTTIHIPFRLLGFSAGGFGPPISLNQNDPVEKEIEEELIAQLSKSIDLQFKSNSREEWLKLPKSLRFEVLSFIEVIGSAAFILDQYTKPILENTGIDMETSDSSAYAILSEPWNNRQLTSFRSVDCIGYADLRKLSFASRLVSEQVLKLINALPDTMDQSFTGCFIESNLGRISIFGSKNDTILGNNCLTIDIGGDDKYLGNIASSGISIPVSIVIDKEGDDSYNAVNGFLSLGLLGISILFDLDGDDSYASGNPGMASSLYGTSLIFDVKGDDIYASTSSFSQGSAMVGVAMLMDQEGDDHYYCSSYSQGFGSTLGVGMLVDLKGNDCYGKHPKMEDPLSFVQGAAKGRWAEATDGQSLGGGYGFLFDFEGDDSYHAESFSQGSAYYFGVGALYDQNGRDTYRSISHSQGYAAHFALGNLMEIQGDDSFNQDSDKKAITQIIGGGRDFSAGLFLDYSGNDSYVFGNRSAGIGDFNGIGIMCDLHGNDGYTWFKNDMNRGSPSMGGVAGSEKGTSIGFRLFKPKSPGSLGLFSDNQGDNNFFKTEE